MSADERAGANASANNGVKNELFDLTGRTAIVTGTSRGLGQNFARALAKAGIAVVAQIPCEAPPSSYSTGYLGTKKHRMGHTLTLV